MIIENNTVATLVYSIHLNDVYGKVIENAQNEPKDLIFGFGKMIDGFEGGLLGRKAGDSFSFEIEPARAFGEYRSDIIIDVPKSAFMVNGKLRDELIYIGNMVSMMDNHGHPLKGKVLEIGDEKIKMDFNHELAGESLFVTGKVLKVRQITTEDLEPKSGCGCGSGGGCSTEGENEHSGCGCSTEKEHSHDDGGCGCGSGCGC